MATKQDSTTRDIKDRLRGAFSRAPKYATSTAKMFLASGKDFFNIQMPIIGGMLETNQDLIRDTVTFLRNPVDSVNKQIDTALNSENFKELKRFGQNALEDLKSGNLYDPNRDRSEFGMNVDALLSDFGGFDMDGFDENGDWDESNIDISGIEGEKAIAEVQEENASKRTAATIDAIGASTEAVVNTNNANAQLNLKMSMKQHAQLMSAMQNSITAQTATFELMNKSINASLDVTREAHNQMMSQINDIKGLLSEIRDAVKPPKEEKEYKEQDEIFGPNGELNIRNWLKQVKKNADEKYSISSSISMATGGIDFKTFMSTIADNPWKLVTDYLVGQLVPESTKKQMSRTNRNASNFFSALLNKAYSRGQAFERGDSDSILDAFLGLLGVPQRSRTMIDTEYQNPLAPAQFTSKTTRAIEEVIPMWLSRIYSAVSGNPLEVYNYKTGKYERAANIVNRTERNARDLVGRMGDTGRMMFERARAYKWETDEDRKEFEDFLYRYLQRVGERSEFVNPYLTREEFTRNFPDTSKKDQYYNLLYGILKGIPYDQLMQISRDVSEARQARNRSNFDINKELKDSGLISAYSLNDDFLEKVKSRSTLTYESLGEVELDALSREHMEAVRKAGNTVAGTNVILNDILGTLRKGIITYSYDLGLAPTKPVEGSTETSSAGRQMSELIQNVLDQSSRQRNIELNIQQKQLDQKAYAARRTQDEKKRAATITMDPTKPWVENLLAEGMSADVAEQYQQAVNIKLNPEDPNNKGSKRYQELFDKVVDDEVKMLRSEADNLQRGSKIGGILSFVRQAAREPFRLFEQGLQIMDNFMFKALFGEDAMEGIEDKGEPYLLQVLTHSLDVHFANAKDWFAKNIGGPLKDFFLDKDTGLLPRIGSAFDETFGISEKAGKIKEKAKAKASEIKTKFTGTKDEATGLWSGGILSETINKIGEDKVTIADYIKGSIDRLLYGDLVAKKGHDIGFVLDDQGRWVESEKYSGVIGTLKKGFKTTTAFLFGEGEDYDKSMDRLKKMKDEVNKALPNMVIDAGIGLVGSFFLPGGPLLGALLGSVAGLVQGSDSIKNVLFGEMTDDFKKDKDGNLILGEDGKPIPTGTQSRKGGMISQQVYDGFRQYAPKVGIGALAGGVLGSFGLLPFGMGQMAGAIIGGMGGMLGASEQVKELIFGDGINDDSGVISKNFRKKVVDQVKRYAPAGIGGAALGGLLGQGFGLLPGLSLLPGGPIFSFLGATMGLANADKINEFFFGTEATKTVQETDPETGKVSYVQRTIREGGIFNKMTDFARDHMLKPFTNKINEAGAKISEWFQNDIYGPLSRTLDPLKAELTKAGSSILESMKNIGNTITEAMFNAIGIAVNDKDGKGGLRAFFQEHIIDPMKNMANRMFSAIGKAIGTLLSAPFKALEFIVTGDIGGKDDLDEKRDKKKEKKKETLFERMRNQVRDDARKKDLNRAKQSFKKAGAQVGGFFSRLFGKKDDTKTSNKPGGGTAGATGTGPTTTPTGPSGVNAHEKDDFGLTNPGMEPGAAFAADMKKAREASVNNEAKKQETKDNLEDKQSTTTQSAKNAAETEKATRERTTRIRGKSNNQLLTSIEKYIRKIYHEMDGQINGVGWNTAYIRALLDKQFGGLSAEELPEEMEGSKRKIRKRRTIIGRAKDAVTDFFGGIRDRAVGVVSGVRDRVAGLFEIVLKPFRLAGKAAELLFTVVKGVGSGIVEAAKVTGSIMKKILLGAAEGLGRTLAGVGRLIYKAAGGIGEALGNVVSTLTGVLHDLTLAVTSTAVGLIQTVAAIAPDIITGVWKGATKLGKLAWKGIKGGVKGVAGVVGGGLSWLGNKLMGKRGTKTKTKRHNIGTFEISGGYLDHIDEAFMKIGDPLTPSNFPVVTVFNGISRSMETHAIPVYILGAARKAFSHMDMPTGGPAQTAEQVSDTRGNAYTAPSDVIDITDDVVDVTPKNMPRESKEIQSANTSGTQAPHAPATHAALPAAQRATTQPKLNIPNITLPALPNPFKRGNPTEKPGYYDTPIGAKGLFMDFITGRGKNQLYLTRPDGKIVRADPNALPPEVAAALASGKKSFVYKEKPKALPAGPNLPALPMGGSIDKHFEESNENSKALNLAQTDKFVATYSKVDRQAERSRNPAQVYDEAMSRAQTREEAEAIMAAQQMNANRGLVTAGGTNTEKSEKSESFFDQLIKEVLPTVLTLGLPLISMVLGASGEGTQFTTHGAESFIMNALRGVGLDKLSPNQIKSIFTDPDGAAKVAGEFAEKSGKKAAKTTKTVGALGKLSDFITLVKSPMNADMMIDMGKQTGGLKGAAMQAKGSAAKAVSNAASSISSLKSKVTSIISGLIDKILSNKVVQQIAGKLLPKLKGLKNKIISLIVSTGLDKAVKQVGSKTIGSVVRQLGGLSTGFILTAGFAIVDFYTGMNDAYKAFGVSASDVTIGMKIATGITRALTGAIAAIPVPVLTTVLSIALSFVESNIAQLIYSAVADEDAMEELQQNQQELQSATDAYNEANGTDLSTTEYAKQFNKDGSKRATGIIGAIQDFGSNVGGLIGAAGSSILNGAKGLLGSAGKAIGGAASTVWNGIKGVAGTIGGGIANAAGTVWDGLKGAAGKGPMKHFKQSDPRWNQPGSDMAMTGCGPTVAAMVASAYGKGPANPSEADTMSKNMGMRTSDGGTDPAFFKKYAHIKGFGMEQGPTSTGMISSNLSKERPVVLMGKGGAFGGNDHYLVADKLAGKGKVNVTDPITGGSKAVGMDALLRNTNTTIYSYGKGPDTEIATGTTSEDSNRMSIEEAQAALVGKMASAENKIRYTIRGGEPQDPDKGWASCASTVGWAYRKVFGDDAKNMSANCDTQSKDTRFVTVWTNTGTPLDLSVLQPGDILYMNWDQTRNNGDMDHAEMYAGNGFDWSHGGPNHGDLGTNKKSLNDYRRKHTMMVRRYGPISRSTDGYVSTDPAALNNPTFNNSGSSYIGDSSSSSSVNPDDPIGVQFLSQLTDIIKNGSKSLDNILNQISGDPPTDESGNTTDSTAGSSTGSNVNFGDGNYKQYTATESSNRIWQALKNFGYTDYAASGIMGCWQAESSNRADRVEGDYLGSFPGFQKVLESNASLNNYTTGTLFPAYQRSNISIDESGYKGNDGNYYPGIGLAQWTGPRGYNLFKYAVDNNKDWRDLDTQLAFFNSEIASRGLKDTLNSATSASDAARKMLDGYEMYSGYSSKAPSAYEKRAGYANGIYANYAGSGSSSEDKSTTSTGKGPGLEEFDEALNYGKGPSANLEAMNNQISAINAQIKKAKQQTDDESTASKLTKSVTDAIEKTVSTGDTNSDVVNVLSTSLSKMIELLAAIKDNTDPKNNQGGPTSGQQRELPTVRADNFGADGTNTGVGTNTEDIGATIMNTLTAR